MELKVFENNLENFKAKGIYRIGNTINNKSYIGSTWKSFRSRWQQHLSKLNLNKHHSKELQNAFNKYGTDCFFCEVLEIVESEDLLLERETFYIEKFDSYKNGYNENPTPSNSPMLQNSSREKSSKTHKQIWEELEKTMSKEDFENYKKDYLEKRGLIKGKTPWNKGIKMSEQQTINMRKPKINGVSDNMKQVHKNNSQNIKDKSDYVIVYDSNNNWLNTFWCISDLVEYSKSEYNNLPIKVRKGGTLTLDPSKISNHLKDGKLYKGLFLRRAPKSWKLSCANAVNSWKAKAEPIMSQAEDTSSEGAETTGEVQSS